MVGSSEPPYPFYGARVLGGHGVVIDDPVNSFGGTMQDYHISLVIFAGDSFLSQSPAVFLTRLFFSFGIGIPMKGGNQIFMNLIDGAVMTQAISFFSPVI